MGVADGRDGTSPREAHEPAACEISPDGGEAAPQKASGTDGAPTPQGMEALLAEGVEAFRARMRAQAAPLWRDLAWRDVGDPYLVWISEVMLQQTQVARVQARWDDWLARFPTVEALAHAPQAEVLQAWQGMGYNRRALSLHRCAQTVADVWGGAWPHEAKALAQLPGIGPSTAAGIRAFAFDEAGVYLETNVRTVFIHEFFPGADKVSDKQLAPLVELACPPSGRDVRGWYYALLDVGAHLKKTLPNPGRRAAAYTRQSRFEGSRRQKRAALVRILLDAHATGEPLPTEALHARLGAQELAAGRPAPDPQTVQDILTDLAKEGFCACTGGLWAAR